MTPSGQNPSPTSYSIPGLTFQDLQDPAEEKLNRVLQLLAGQIGSIQGSGGMSTFTNPITAPDFFSTDTNVPTNPNELLTLGAATALFNPNQQRNSFLSGQWFGVEVAPLPIQQSSVTQTSSVIEAADFCGGASLSDACINAAIQSAPASGGAIHCKAGVWSIGAPILMNVPNIRLYGDGDSTVFNVNGALTFTGGVIQVTAGSVRMDSFKFAGNISSSTQITYATLASTLGSDPMHPDLTNNSAFFISNGITDGQIFDVTIENCGGYAIVFDARGANISQWSISYCNLINNVAIAFGGAPYGNTGSWCGGIFFKGGGGVDYTGHTWGNFACSNMIVDHCTFNTISGNCVWAHSYGFAYGALHSMFSWTNNIGQWIGQDWMEPGCVINSTVSSNIVNYVGYLSGVPVYYPGAYAVALDCSGYARNVNYILNVATNVNGGCADLDGLFESNFIGNTLAIADSTDVDYAAAQITAYGVLGAGNTTIGIHTNNTYTPLAAQKLLISGNTVKNMGFTGISLTNAQNCEVTGNNINHPSSSGDAPITLSSSGTNSAYTSPPRYCANNTIAYNSIFYFSPNQFCVYETDAYGTGMGPNFVFGNILNGSTSGEFLPSTNGLAAGSNTSLNFYTNTATSGTPQRSLARTKMQREGVIGSSGLVNTSGTAVTWTFGNNFDSGMAGGVMTINGVPYLVAAYIDSTHVTLFTTAGTQTGVPYSAHDTGSTKVYSVNQSGSPGAAQILQVGDADGIVNVSVGGQAGTGRVALGARSSFGFLRDYFYGGKGIFDDFIVAGNYHDNVAFFDSEANTLIDDYGLMRYNRVGVLGTGGAFEISVATSGGVRVWTSISGGGGGSPGGASTDVQVNKAGGFYGDGNFVYNYAAQAVTITGVGNSSGVVNTSGTAVTWVSGATFSTAWTSITINGVVYAIASVNSTTSITLSSSAGTQTGVAYSVAQTAGLTVNPGYIASYGGFLSNYASWEAFQGYQSGGGAVMNGYGLTPYSSKGGYIDMAPIGYGTFPVPLTGLASFGASDVLLWAAASNGTVTPVISQGLICNAFIDAAAGFKTSATAYNSIQTPSGGMYASKGFTGDQGTFLFGYATSGSLFTPGAGYGCLGPWKSGSVFWYWNGSAYATVDLSAIGGGFWSASGANIYNNNTGNVGIGVASPAYILDVGSGFFHTTYNVQTYPASASGGGLAIGWNYSAGQAEVNFYNVYNSASIAFQFAQKTGASTSAILMTIGGSGNVGIGNASPGYPLTIGAGNVFIVDGSGNATMAGTMLVTGPGVNVNLSTNYRAIQAPSGGIYSVAAMATLYTKIGISSGVPTDLAGGSLSTNGSMYYDSGLAVIRAYINGVWTTLAAGSGVTSINSQTGPAITVAQGTGVTVNITTNTVTISIGQAVATTSNVTFQSVDVSLDLQWGSSLAANLNSSGGANFQAAIAMLGSNIINSGGQWVGNSILVGSSGVGAATFAWWNGSGYISAPDSTTTLSSITSITVSGGIVTAVSGVSDARLKTVVGPFNYGMDALRTVHPIEYRWNSKAEEMYRLKSDHIRTGFLAQELQHISGATTMNKDGYLDFDRDTLLATIIVALKDLDRRIHALNEP
jgi:parallel beta-helix repeat protein